MPELLAPGGVGLGTDFDGIEVMRQLRCMAASHGDARRHAGQSGPAGKRVNAAAEELNASVHGRV